MKVVVSPDPNVNWKNDAIQFPRLIAELEAEGVLSGTVAEQVAQAMDLTVPEVLEIVDRAQAVWDRIKARTVSTR